MGREDKGISLNKIKVSMDLRFHWGETTINHLYPGYL